jgi:hypothetical protein
VVHSWLAALDRHPSARKQIVDALLVLRRERRKIASNDLPQVNPIRVLKVGDVGVHPRDGRRRLYWSARTL